MTLHARAGFSCKRDGLLKNPLGALISKLASPGISRKADLEEAVEKGGMTIIPSEALAKSRDLVYIRIQSMLRIGSSG